MRLIWWMGWMCSLVLFRLALAGADLRARAICTGLLDWEEACCRCRDHGQALCDSRDSREDFLGEFSLQ